MQRSFNNKWLLVFILCLSITLLIDTSLIRVYDLINKNFIQIQNKTILFALNISLCFLFQFIIIRYLQNIIRHDRRSNQINSKLYKIYTASALLLGSLVGYAIFQEFYNNYYDKYILIFIIIISYATASLFLIRLSILFISWYKSKRNMIILLYSISISLIAFNLIVTGIITNVSINDRPSQIREYVGGSVNIFFNEYKILSNLQKISAIISFISIWITTAVLLNTYKSNLIRKVVYWSILSVPLIYFSINYFSQVIFHNILISYLALDPVTASLILTIFLSLSKPIGGLTFGIVFWRISKTVSYEKNIKSYMIISGLGILLIFATNQAILLTIGPPYPPFGVATITILIVASYLMLVGIYNSAALSSTNINIRKSVQKVALDSKLLNVIGRAEMDKEIQNVVSKAINKIEKSDDNTQPKLDLDEKELKKYVEEMIKLKKESAKSH